MSNTLNTTFCVETLKQAFGTGRRPEIFNTDQGNQFTSEVFTRVLTEAGIAISMDGVGRAFDNIMVERLWRTVKYEEVYLRDYQTPAEARLGLGRYFGYYNHLRRHRSLDRRPPASVYGLAEPGAGEKLLVRPARRDRIETSAFAKASAVAPPRQDYGGQVGGQGRRVLRRRACCCCSGRPSGSLRNRSGNVTHGGCSTLFQVGNCPAHGDKMKSKGTGA